MKAIHVILLTLGLLLAGCSSAPEKEPLHLFDDVAVGDSPSTVTVLWPHSGEGVGYVNWVETFLTTKTNDAIGWLEVDEDSKYVEVTKSAGPFYEQGDGVKIKLFAWDSAAYLVAGMTNLTVAEEIVPWVSGYYELTSPVPDKVYYLGAGDAPEGMDKLPSELDSIAANVDQLLVGQPVGGVISFKVLAEEWEYGNFLGDLYVAVQITELVQPQS